MLTFLFEGTFLPFTSWTRSKNSSTASQPFFYPPKYFKSKLFSLNESFFLTHLKEWEKKWKRLKSKQTNFCLRPTRGMKVPYLSQRAGRLAGHWTTWQMSGLAHGGGMAEDRVRRAGLGRIVLACAWQSAASLTFMWEQNYID